MEQAGATVEQPSTSKTNGSISPSRRRERRRSLSRNRAPIFTVNKAKPAYGQIHRWKDNRACEFCGLPRHSLAKCGEFLRTTLKDRWDWAKTTRVCYNCLERGHRATQCQRGPCGLDNCSDKHHYMLHDISRREEKNSDKDEASSRAAKKGS